MILTQSLMLLIYHNKMFRKKLLMDDLRSEFEGFGFTYQELQSAKSFLLINNEEVESFFLKIKNKKVSKLISQFPLTLQYLGDEIWGSYIDGILEKHSLSLLDNEEEFSNCLIFLSGESSKSKLLNVIKLDLSAQKTSRKISNKLNANKNYKLGSYVRTDTAITIISLDYHPRELIDWITNNTIVEPKLKESWVVCFQNNSSDLSVRARFLDKLSAEILTLCFEPKKITDVISCNKFKAVHSFFNVEETINYLIESNFLNVYELGVSHD